MKQENTSSTPEILEKRWSIVQQMYIMETDAERSINLNWSIATETIEK